MIPKADANQATRRTFLKSLGAATAMAATAPVFLHAADKTGSKAATVGEKEFIYECQHNWGKLPNHVHWGNTHGVALDKQGHIYIKHQNSGAEAMDAIVVFDSAGKFVRSFGKEYHGGGHGIDIREEGGQEFLYLSDVKNRCVVKSDTKGEHVWKLSFPQEAGVYKNINQFRPTNVAFAPDGGFYIADGYGAHYIHQYDKDAKWIRTFGGEGAEPGKMKTPHGLWLDNRPGREPALVVADRANARLQYFALDGEHQSFVDGFSFPADIDLQGEVLLVPDLHARITLLDKDNQVITHLGYDPAWTTRALAGFKMRGNPADWVEGRFVHPHDAAFDTDGNIYVTEWVATGRVTKLVKV